MRQIWSVLKWTLLALLAAVLLVVGINAFDEPLRPEVKAALAPPTQTAPPQDNLFYALLGFQAPPSADVVQAGLAEHRRLEQSPPTGRPGSYEEQTRRRAGEDQPGALRFQGDERQLRDVGSTLGEVLASLKERRIDGRAVVDANPDLLERYRWLRRHGRFANYFSARLDALTIPPYAGATRARAVWMIWLAGQVARGEAEPVARELHEDILAWRRVLAQPEMGLVDKMVMVAWVQRDFASASELLHRGGLDAQQRRLLAEAAAPLTPAERSLAGVFARELRVLSDALGRQAREDSMALLGGRHDREATPPTLQRRLMARGAAYFFQLDATLNQYQRALAGLVEMDAKGCRSYEADQHALQVAAEPDWWRIAYNPMGKLALAAAGNGAIWHPYRARMCDLQGFQRLLALQIRLLDQGATPGMPQPQLDKLIEQAGADYTDPFTGSPMLWVSDRQALAFGARDDRNRKMLPWPL